MSPHLPHSLIEREVRCDLCDNWSTQPALVEMRGSSYVLCPECVADNQLAIRASACEDMAGADASDADCGK